MEPTKVYPIVAVLSLVTVEYGGWALLTFISARRGQLNDFQTQFFRAGHAHAGVLLVLSLVYFLTSAARPTSRRAHSGSSAPSCWPACWRNQADSLRTSAWARSVVRLWARG